MAPDHQHVQYQQQKPVASRKCIENAELVTSWTVDNTSMCVRKAEYAVRGRLAIRAEELRKVSPTYILYIYVFSKIFLTRDRFWRAENHIIFRSMKLSI
jgi:hypothetical protein